MTCRRSEPKATRHKTLRLTLPATKFQIFDHHRVHDLDEYDHHGHGQGHKDDCHVKYEDYHYNHDQAEDDWPSWS